MFDALGQFIGQSAEILATNFIKVMAYPALSNQRIYWLYLLTSLALAFYAYRSSLQTTSAGQSSFRSFIRFLFPRDIWSTESAWLDVRYFFFHQIFRVVIYGAFLTGALNTVFQLVSGGPNVIAASAAASDLSPSGIAISLVYMFVLIGFSDLVAYGLHYMQHKVPVLWEFHKVHHSLEVMHPLSNYREHPVDNFVYAGFIGAAYGLVMGLASLLFGYVPSMPELLGIPLLMFAFNLLGYNLRHSHVWLRWPGNWSKAFASPAHHQVHHSCHPDHLDKNFGFLFPWWDVLFKTYVVPETNKDLRFGIAGDYVNEYKSCLGLYFIPFRNLWRRYTNRTNRSADLPSQTNS